MPASPSRRSRITDLEASSSRLSSEDRTLDPPTPHISLHSPLDPHHSHSLACTPLPATLPPLTDGREYALRVQWSAASRRVGVWLAEGGEEGRECEWQWLYGAEVPEEQLRGGGEDKVWLGVSAACGGLNERHEVGGWKMWEVNS